VLGADSPTLGDGYVKWLLVRIVSDVVLGAKDCKLDWGLGVFE